MNVIPILLKAAKTYKVAGVLLIAICSHESNGFTINYSPHDHGSPSFGVCQLKFDTAKMLGYEGSAKNLMNVEVNAEYASKYLRYEQDRYGDDWCRLTAAYNSGSYNPSNKVEGCPRNLRYIRAVQKRLPDKLKYKLNCGE